MQLAVAFDASPQPRQAGDRTRTSAFCLWRLLLHETIVGPALPGKQAGEHSRTDKPSLVPSRALGTSRVAVTPWAVGAALRCVRPSPLTAVAVAVAAKTPVPSGQVPLAATHPRQTDGVGGLPTGARRRRCGTPLAGWLDGQGSGGPVAEATEHWPPAGRCRAVARDAAPPGPRHARTRPSVLPRAPRAGQDMHPRRRRLFPGTGRRCGLHAEHVSLPATPPRPALHCTCSGSGWLVAAVAFALVRAFVDRRECQRRETMLRTVLLAVWCVAHVREGREGWSAN